MPSTGDLGPWRVADVCLGSCAFHVHSPSQSSCLRGSGELWFVQEGNRGPAETSDWSGLDGVALGAGPIWLPGFVAS